MWVWGDGGGAVMEGCGRGSPCGFARCFLCCTVLKRVSFRFFGCFTQGFTGFVAGSASVCPQFWSSNQSKLKSILISRKNGRVRTYHPSIVQRLFTSCYKIGWSICQRYCVTIHGQNRIREKQRRNRRAKNHRTKKCCYACPYQLLASHVVKNR